MTNIIAPVAHFDGGSMKKNPLASPRKIPYQRITGTNAGPLGDDKMTEKFEGSYADATVNDKMGAAGRLTRAAQKMQEITTQVLSDLAVINKGDTREMGADFSAFMLTFTLAFTRAIAKPGTDDESIHRLHREFVNKGFRVLMETQEDRDEVIPPELRAIMEAMGLDPANAKVFKL